MFGKDLHALLNLKFAKYHSLKGFGDAILKNLDDPYQNSLVLEVIDGHGWNNICFLVFGTISDDDEVHRHEVRSLKLKDMEEQAKRFHSTGEPT
ncbi:MAG: hypothetical protein MZV64_34735 [Ignavibacteriales bacterium]|nr:hypothetical protein [Ignavibacteriales bacterium]